jgi:uncharacterized repeat protein (TIGR01451 family)
MSTRAFLNPAARRGVHRGRASRIRRATATVGAAVLCLGLLAACPSKGTHVPARTTFEDITPNDVGEVVDAINPKDDCADPCASGHDGGRVNGLWVTPPGPGTPSVAFAASEVGGLFKSGNGGGSWQHLDGHVPNLTWDVAAQPGGSRVYATSFYDGRSAPITGLQQSTDGGTTWSRPDLPAPPRCSDARKRQPSAFGIALRPGTLEVLAGTNCGLARSPDGGGNWTRFDPVPGLSADSIWDVVALAGGQTYACGDDGLLTSASGAPGSWTSIGKPPIFPGGQCSVAVSPEEPTVVFVSFAIPSFVDIATAGGERFYEVDLDGSTPTWTLFPAPDDDPTTSVIDNKSRVPFVVTNDRLKGYDLWLGDGSLWRVPCQSGQTPRCSIKKQEWAGSYSDHLGGAPNGLPRMQQAHGDSGDLVFDPGVSVDACPMLYSSDGGIYLNKATACQNPVFHGANVGLHAFDLHAFAGVHRSGADDEDLYFGTQDNGLYYTSNAGRVTPTWMHRLEGDVIDVVADTTRVVTQQFGIQTGGPGFSSPVLALSCPFPNTCPPPQPFWDSEALVQAGSNRYLLAVYAPFEHNGDTIPVGVRAITDFTSPTVGAPFGLVPWPAGAQPPCHITVGAGPSGPQPYVLAGRCWLGTPKEGGPDQLWTFRNGGWQRIPTPPAHPGNPVPAGAGFSMIGVDPNDARRVYASVLGDGSPRMMRSTDGGASWDLDEDLSALMNGNGLFVDPVDDPGDGIAVIPEPLMVTYDDIDPHIIVAAGRQSGVFLSSDAGDTWALLTNPFAPGPSSVIPALPQPGWAHFDHDAPGHVRVYLGTGRGIWRVTLANVDLSVTKADTPDPVVLGTDLTYTVQVSNNGPDSAQNATMRDVLPNGMTLGGVSAPAGWVCHTPIFGPPGPVECTTPVMAPGTATFTILAHVVSVPPSGTAAMNTARAFSADIDPNQANNSDVEQTTVDVAPTPTS